MEKTTFGSFEKKLILPGSESYNEARKVWNGAIDRYPKMIVACDATEDVVQAVQLAKKENLPISVRGGSHHVAGTAVCDDGVMIDLSKMNRVSVDEKRKVAYVDGGATLGDVDRETQKFGLATPTGTASETGIAGLALNGGLGYLRGKYGLTCDNIVGAQLVTADGEVLHVTEKSYPDLYWAIRGGGGNFGVVTQFEFNLYPVGPNVLGLDVMYSFDDAKEVLQKAQAYLNEAPDEVSFNLTVTQLPPAPFLPEALHHKKVIIAMGLYAGDPEDGEKVIQPLRELANPLVDQTGVIPFVDLQKKLDPMIVNHIPVYGTSLYLGNLDDKLISKLTALVDEAPSPGYIFQLWGLSGQMNRVDPTATPFAIRDAIFALLVDIMTVGEGVDEKACEIWKEKVYDEILPYSHKQASYLNGIGLDDQVTKNAFAENYARLREIKKKYDPTNVFRFNHNIK